MIFQDSWFKTKAWRMMEKCMKRLKRLRNSWFLWNSATNPTAAHVQSWYKLFVTICLPRRIDSGFGAIAIQKRHGLSCPQSPYVAILPQDRSDLRHLLKKGGNSVHWFKNGWYTSPGVHICCYPYIFSWRNVHPSCNVARRHGTEEIRKALQAFREAHIKIVSTNLRWLVLQHDQHVGSFLFVSLSFLQFAFQGAENHVCWKVGELNLHPSR